MGVTSIEWTTRSWNPVRGTKGRHICQRISAGCKNCYAATMNRRFSGIDYVVGADVPRLDERALWEPLRWRSADRCFVCSMTDLFWEAILDEWIDRVFAVMALCPTTIFQVLTKRPERMRSYFAAGGVLARIAEAAQAMGRSASTSFKVYPVGPDAEFGYRWFVHPFPLPNVHLGVSVENQATADERIPLLLQTPAAVRFLSVEPLLGPVNVRGHVLGVERTAHCRCGHGHGFTRCPNTGGVARECHHKGCPCPGFQRVHGIHWAIVGGESGPGARPCDVAWIRSVVAQCKAAAVPCFVKQLGSRPTDSSMRDVMCNGERHYTRPADDPFIADCEARIADGRAPGYSVESHRLELRDRKGGSPDEWPPDLRVRESPCPTS